MTTEAREWIGSLIRDPRGVFFEIESNSLSGISRVALDVERLTEEEIDKALDFCKNGSPEISVEYRSLEYQDSLLNSPS